MLVLWANAHWIGRAVSHCYVLLLPMMAAAVFVPAFTGRLKDGQRLLIANLIAFAIATPLFAVVPALGPWAYYHFPATADQTYCQLQLIELRAHGTYLFQSQGAGIVSFPSFHVIWAILCGSALWGFRKLRANPAYVGRHSFFYYHYRLALFRLRVGWGADCCDCTLDSEPNFTRAFRT